MTIVAIDTGEPQNVALPFQKGKHKEGCICTRCDRTPIACPYDGCDEVRNGRRALGSHVAWRHKRRRRGFAKVMVPDSLGYFKAVFRDPHRLAQLHLGELPKFAQRLAELSNNPRRTQRARRRLLAAAILSAAEAAERSPAEPFVLSHGDITVPAGLAQIILSLAKEADVTPKVISVALMSYGLELLAQNLRAYKTAPEPRLNAPSSPLINAKEAENIKKTAQVEQPEPSAESTMLSEPPHPTRKGLVLPTC